MMNDMMKMMWLCELITIKKLCPFLFALLKILKPFSLHFELGHKIKQKRTCNRKTSPSVLITTVNLLLLL